MFLCFSRLSGQPQKKLAVLPTCAQMESKPPTLLIKKASFLCATTLQREEKSFTFKFYILWFFGIISILKRSWGLMYTGCVHTKMLSTLHGWPRSWHTHISSSLELLAMLGNLIMSKRAFLRVIFTLVTNR